MTNKTVTGQSPSSVRIRRCCICLLFCVFLTAGTGVNSSPLDYARNTQLTLKLQNKTLKDVLDAIIAGADVSFSVNTSQVDLSVPVDVDIENKSVFEILRIVLDGTGIDYEIDDRHIILFNAPAGAQTPPSAQEPDRSVTVRGTVRDNTGAPVIGASVVEQGTTNGVVTDNKGEYRITVAGPGSTLQFSFLGYSTEQKQVGSQTTIDVTLGETTSVIEDVVVVGYGIQRKESVVAAIVQASSEDLQRSGNVTDLKQALTGRLPGVITSVGSGEPGGFGDGESATSIFIRGRNSWNNSQPLILVDGVERNMDNVDVNEVESISVLKDASATAVFGVKGANGVILITTKRGRKSAPEISLTYEATALMTSKLPDKLDSYDALGIRNESILRDVALDESLWSYFTPDEIRRRYRERDYDNWKYIYPNVDWKKAMFRDVGWTHKTSLNIRGGTDFVKYFGSISYLHEGDMFNRSYDNNKGYDPSYAYDRFNFRSNFDFAVTRTTNLRVNLAGYYSQKDTNHSWYHQEGGTNPGMWAAAYRLAPDLFYPQYPDGTWGVSTGSGDAFLNPVALAYNLGVIHRRTVSLNADFALEQKLDFITPGLSATFTIAYDNSVQTFGGLRDYSNHVRPETGGNTPSTYYFRDLYTGPDQDPSEYTRFAIISSSTDFDWMVRPWYYESEYVSGTFRGWLPVYRRMKYQGQINYSRKFDRHSVSALALVAREEYARGSEFNHYREDWVFRAAYDYDSRYFFEGNGAYNGSEQFSPEYRFDFFPSFALGWYVSNESFFNVNWFNRLKLRGSLGWVGDDAGTGSRWIYMSDYSYGGSARLQENANATSPYNIYRQSVVANPDIRWEKARKSNIGVEAGFFNENVTLNFDYFTEKRTDIMISGNSRSIPPYFGGVPPSANLGRVKARGYEIELGWNRTTRYGLNYWANLAVTHTRNKVLFADDPLLQAAYLKSQGYSIGQTKSLIRGGFYNNWDEVFASVPHETNDHNKIPGFYNIIDFDGDGLITSVGDSAPYGYPDIPENTFNLTLGAQYKGFSVVLQFYGVNNVTRQVQLPNFNDGQNIVYGHARDYWSKDNMNASSYLPRFQTVGSFIGDYHYYDGSFIRLKTAEVAYNFQRPVLKALGLSSLRVFVNGNNLWFWSRLPDDRENHWVGGYAQDGAYPTLKRINMGLNITF